MVVLVGGHTKLERSTVNNKIWDVTVGVRVVVVSRKLTAFVKLSSGVTIG